MSQTVLVDNEFITLVYLPDKRLIHHTVHQPVPGTVLREALNSGTDALQKYGVCKWLSDDRKNGPLPDDVADWGFADWNQRTIQAGWKYWALVVPEEMIAAGTLTPTIMDLSRYNLRTVVFRELEEAFAWLDSREG